MACLGPGGLTGLDGCDDFHADGLLQAVQQARTDEHFEPEPRAARRRQAKLGGKEFIYCFTGSLFVYQYGHAWIDFRNKRDNFANYWDNSVEATLANRQFCIDNLRTYQGFGENMWGLTACIGPSGYKGYGGGPGNPSCDGTIAPSAVAGSIPFCPEMCISTLRNIYDQYADKAYGPYGFKNGFKLGCDWWCEEYLGIDTGISMLMIENYRTGFVWKYFTRHPDIQKWYSACFSDDIKNESKKEVK